MFIRNYNLCTLILLFLAPYNKTNCQFSSTITCYWILPSFENQLHDYGRPMNMNFVIKPENILSSDIVMALVCYFILNFN